MHILSFTANKKSHKLNRPRVAGSVFGLISDPGCFSEFSAIKKDGTGINAELVHFFAEAFKACGCDITREITFCVDEKGCLEFTHFLPWVFKNGKYDLSEFNRQYFQNLRRIVEIYNANGIRFVFSLFDRCHGEKMPTSPWRLNHNGVNSMFSETASKFRIGFVHHVIEWIGDLAVDWEICNEPMSDGFPAMAAEVLQILNHRGYYNWQVLQGVNYFPHENDRYKVFKKAARKVNLYDKKKQYSCVHKVDEDFFRDYVDLQKHTRRYWFSDDGKKPKHNAEWWFVNLSRYFEEFDRPPWRNKLFANRTAFEHLSRTASDDRKGCMGITAAINEYIKKWE